ncbi:MAG: DUF2270 domain-containing protein [Anaerolineales bacterium]|nr:DUF2270 domain-containing protein [Anaerolineales bacterium]
MSTPPPPDSPPSDSSRPAGEPVWTFRGYEMRPPEFNTAMVHYYRAEIQRSNIWRTRLDATTNWAVVATGAAISFVLAAPENHYAVIILNTLLVTLFVWIEARRYRYYELWAHRTRLMETDFFAAMLVPPFAPSPEWAESLAESLLQPDFPISMWEAFGRRLRRNYLWIFIILALAWGLKTYLHPVPAVTWEGYVARLAIGGLPGWVILAAGVAYNVVIFAIGLLTAGLTQASGEVLPKVGGLPLVGPLLRSLEVHDSEAAPKVPTEKTEARAFRRRKQLLALIISSQPKAIADHVLKDLRRGATALHGRGMYAQQERDVLMVAITITEMERLKAIVRTVDPNAFVVVAPAQEILGRGFQPLEGRG